MAFTAILAADVDAKSPVSDDVMDLIRTNLDHVYSMISDGASAAEDISGKNMTLSGTLTVGTFFSSEQLLFIWD